MDNDKPCHAYLHRSSMRRIPGDCCSRMEWCRHFWPDFRQFAEGHCSCPRCRSRHLFYFQGKGGTGTTLSGCGVPVCAQHLHCGADGSLHDVFANQINNMVANPVSSIVNANYIGILFWSIIFGFALKKIASQHTINVVHDLAEMVSLAVKWVIQFAPFGIMGLVFATVSSNGLDVFASYGHLMLILIGCMLTTALVLNPLISFLLLRRNPYPLLFTCLKESGLNAFFTRSSAANIPINMQLCKKLGLDEDFYSISIPLGATINMDGAAVTITVMSLAVAHTVGVEVGFVSALFLCIIATLGACGASGVAGGSLLLIPMACSFLGIGNDVAMQAVAIGFIIGVVQDSVETALNSSGDVFFTATADFYDRKKRGGAENS